MTMGSRTRAALWLGILLLVALPAWAADPLQVDVDRQQIGLDETLHMRVTAPGHSRGEPDFSGLAKDFDILSQGRSSRMSIINGTVSQTREWTLELSPKHTGTLQIPAISMGSERSRPISIQVIEHAAASGSASADAPILVQSEVDSDHPYVQQTVEYRVKLLFQQSPLRASLSDPVVDGATVERYGKDRNYDQTVNGRRYTVVERRYLIVPQKSGPLTIQGARLEAIVPAPQPNNAYGNVDGSLAGQLFQDFPPLPGLTTDGRRLVERAPDVQLDVRPQPAGAGADWLPATSVSLTEEWTPTPPKFVVGEPLTRTLTITAKGATAAQLPDLKTGTITGAQVYPDQSQGEDLPGASTPSSVKHQQIALVPTQPGSLTLPEIRLSWWDVTADKARVAVIPARTVQVAPAPAGAAAAPVTSSQGGAGDASATPAPASAASSSTPEASTPAAPVPSGDAPAASAQTTVASLWIWLSVFLALGWIATIGWLLLRRRACVSAPATSQPRRPASSSALLRSVEQSCASNDPVEVRKALLEWARGRWADDAPQGLSELAQRAGEARAQVEPVLEAIDRAIYAPQQEAWDGAGAWQVLEPWLRGMSGKTPDNDKDDPLPPLYPDAD